MVIASASRIRPSMTQQPTVIMLRRTEGPVILPHGGQPPNLHCQNAHKSYTTLPLKAYTARREPVAFRKKVPRGGLPSASALRPPRLALVKVTHTAQHHHHLGRGVALGIGIVLVHHIKAYTPAWTMYAAFIVSHAALSSHWMMRPHRQ